jgi:predicted histidine transporter YuiF (NhaC family)
MHEDDVLSIRFEFGNYYSNLIRVIVAFFLCLIRGPPFINLNKKNQIDRRDKGCLIQREERVKIIHIQ